MNIPARSDRRWIPAAAILLLLTAGLQAMAAPVPQTNEDAVEKLLAQGDAYYRQGNYSFAIGTYLEASSRSMSRLNLSAAYFGLSLCYFYQRDNANSLKWLGRTLDVDPNKVISADFYPQAFFRLFQQAKQEARDRNKPAPKTEMVTKPVPRPEPPPPPVEEQPRTVPRREPPAREPDVVPVVSAGRGRLRRSADQGGHWEDRRPLRVLDDQPDPVRLCRER